MRSLSRSTRLRVEEITRRSNHRFLDVAPMREEWLYDDRRSKSLI